MVLYESAVGFSHFSDIYHQLERKLDLVQSENSLGESSPAVRRLFDIFALKRTNISDKTAKSDQTNAKTRW